MLFTILKEIIYNDAISIFNELKNLINLGGENKEK